MRMPEPYDGKLSRTVLRGVGGREAPLLPGPKDNKMSGFMTITGPILDLSDLKPIELIEASKAQDYIQRLEKDLAIADGSPVYLVHDGITGTSDDFIGEAWNTLQLGKSIKGTLLLSLIERLIANGNTFRIWHAANDPNDYLHVKDCFSIDEILRVTSQVKQILIRYLANQKNAPDR